MSAQHEVWRVSTVEGIFETDLETLKQWIAEGCVQPTDKVSKGTLNWIDAGRAPMLRAAFAGDFTPQPPQEPVYPEATGGWQVPPRFDGMSSSGPTSESSSDTQPSSSESTSYEAKSDTPPPINDGFSASTNTCRNHPESAAHFICRMCNATWCETCPRFVSGSKIPLCPSCGDLCKVYKDLANRAAQSEFQASGFGLADFSRAIRYPFQHLAALIGGALIYAFLLMAGFKGAVVAWMIMFGCISHVISQVAWGRLNRSFMPDFSAFSLWDDLVMPIFLGIGITVVTWGPIIALVIALLFGVVGGPAAAPPIVPGQEMAAAAESSAPNEDELKALTDPNADPKKLEAANKKLNNLRPGSQIAQEAERSKSENEPGQAISMLLPYLGAGIVLGVLLLAGLGWAFFYYPMALAVAGYTQSFGSVINPLVGLDTIRRMGLTYFKAFGMVVAVQVVALIVSVIIAIITSPFNLPFVGNLPGNFISACATFYFNLVIACVLGLSLYKCADRLGISVD
ncbi:MAG TPA: hypothetical protein VL866_12745 [Pyrinomonadaceae bacterium]|nr:hypothetical protein [Pyrinomonadaceae bacterium]